MRQFYLWLRCRRYQPNGGKVWGYREAGWVDKDTKEIIQARPCSHCKGKHRHQRYMLGLEDNNKNQALCIWHYVSRRPVEAERLMLWLVRPLSIGVLALLIVASGSTWMAFSHKKVLFRSVVTPQQIENVVDWASKRAPNVARETIRQEVETINEKSPNLAFFVLGCALVDIESKWDPGHRGMMRDKKGKLVPSGARGPGAVVASLHPEEMRRAGCREDQDLHHPVLGTRTAMECLKYYMTKAGGNTSTGLRFYLQGEGTKYQGVDWNMSPEKYLVATVNAEGEIMLVLDSKGQPEKPVVPPKKKAGERKGGAGTCLKN